MNLHCVPVDVGPNVVSGKLNKTHESIATIYIIWQVYKNSCVQLSTSAGMFSSCIALTRISLSPPPWIAGLHWYCPLGNFLAGTPCSKSSSKSNVRLFLSIAYLPAIGLWDEKEDKDQAYQIERKPDLAVPTNLQLTFEMKGNFTFGPQFESAESLKNGAVCCDRPALARFHITEWLSNLW